MALLSEIIIVLPKFGDKLSKKLNPHYLVLGILRVYLDRTYINNCNSI